MSLTVCRHETVDEFLAAAGGFLEAHESENNLVFGISSAIRVSPELFADDPPRFATVTDGDGRVLAATLRTPPNNLVLSWIDDLAAVDALVDAFRDEPLPGLIGPSAAAARFVSGWARSAAKVAQLAAAERAFRLERVIPPERPARGSWRLAEPRDRNLIADWFIAFSAEAFPDDPPPLDPNGAAERVVKRVGRLGYLWEDEGKVVSLVGAGGDTPNGTRIGPVYTPSELRGRGYASSLTAAASQDQLDRGRRVVFLFTDLANPTSNKIYQAIGYEPVCDMDQYRFVDRA